MASGVEDWLSEIKLNEYADLFQQHGYTKLADCNQLTDKILIDMGIIKQGHRKRMLSRLPNPPNLNHVEDRSQPPLPPKTREDKTFGNTRVPEFDSQEYIETNRVPAPPVPVPRKVPPKKPLPPKTGQKKEIIFDDPQYLDPDNDPEMKNGSKIESSAPAIAPRPSVKPPIKPRPKKPPRPNMPKKEGSPSLVTPRAQEKPPVNTHHTDETPASSGPSSKIELPPEKDLPLPPPPPIRNPETHSEVHAPDSDLSKRPPPQVPERNVKSVTNNSPKLAVKQEVCEPIQSKPPPLPTRPGIDSSEHQPLPTRPEIDSNEHQPLPARPDIDKDEHQPSPAAKPASTITSVSPNSSPEIHRMPTRQPPPPPRRTSELSSVVPPQPHGPKTPELPDVFPDSPADNQESELESDDYIDMNQVSQPDNRHDDIVPLRSRPPIALPLHDRDSVRNSRPGFEGIPYVDTIPPLPQQRPTSKLVADIPNTTGVSDVNPDFKLPRPISTFALPPGDSDMMDKPLPSPPPFIKEKSQDTGDPNIYADIDDNPPQHKDTMGDISSSELAYEVLVQQARPRALPISRKKITSDIIDIAAEVSGKAPTVITPTVELPPEPCAYQTTNLIDTDIMSSYRSPPPDEPAPPPPIEIKSPTPDNQATSPLFHSFGKTIDVTQTSPTSPVPPPPPPRVDSQPSEHYAELEAPRPVVPQRGVSDSPPPIPALPGSKLRQPNYVPPPVPPSIITKSAVPPRMAKGSRDSVVSTTSLEPLKDETDDDCRIGYDSEDSDNSEEYEFRVPELVKGIYERRKKTESQSSIQLQSRSLEKQGYLYKQGGKQANRGWRKRWIVFNGRDLRYFGKEGDTVSKRIVPVKIMLDIENRNAVKSTERSPKAYRFSLLTLNRKYQFAADTMEDSQIWATTIMQAIITYRPPEGGLPPGGDMFKPDKKGYVKMDGLKRYIAIKGAVLCYYSGFDDFKHASPISEIQMNIASVRDRGKSKFYLRTPYQNCCFVFENNEEMTEWGEIMDEAIKEGLSDNKALLFVQQEESNRYCADCGAEGADWASINLFVVICKQCAGAHRHLGVDFSKVRSLRMDTTSMTVTIQQLLLKIGNRKANDMWSGLLNPSDRIPPAAAEDHRRVFIEHKYKNKRFLRKHPIRDQIALDEALIAAAVSDECLLDVAHMVFSGADVTATSKLELTAYEVAKENNQTLIMEFLFQNGGGGGPAAILKSPNGSTTSSSITSPSGSESPQLESKPPPPIPSRAVTINPVPANIAEATRYTGYLFKTGSNRKDFQKRYCVFNNGAFSYYLDERASTLKNSIEAVDILSVSCRDLDFALKLGYTYCFELGTRSGRIYVFSAEKQSDQRHWVSTVAKSIAPKDVWDRLEYFDRAGYMYFKEGTVKPWQKSWFILVQKKLMYYSVEENDMVAVDLRKLISISYQQDTSRPSAPDVTQIINVVMPQGYTSMYIGAESKQENEGWFSAIKSASVGSGRNLHEQQLTGDNVPVLVAECIQYVVRHGIKEVGIYRTAGQERKVEGLLQEFSRDARAVRLDSGNYLLNEISNALKRFFRNLPEPLLTKALYPQWIQISGYEHDQKLQWYKHLIDDQLPPINRETLKMLIGHLKNVSDYRGENKMTVANLAAVWGPTLLGSSSNSGDGFGQTNHEIAIIGDIITFYDWLFEISEKERQREQKLQEAASMFEKAQHKRPDTGSLMLIGADIEGQGQINVGVEGAATAAMFLQKIITDNMLDPSRNYAVFEVRHNGALERPIHCNEKILTVASCLEKDDILLVKHNYLKDSWDQSAGVSPYGVLKVSTGEKRGFKKFYMELQDKMLRCFKDAKGASKPEGEWSVDQLNIYKGTDKKSPPSGFSFTFRTEDGKTNRSVCCESSYELSQWLTAMYRAKYPNGFTSGGTPTSAHGTSFDDQAYQLAQTPYHAQPSTYQLSVDGTPILRSPLRDSMGTRFDMFTSELAHKARKFSVRRKK